jgi:hypothetical protein
LDREDLFAYGGVAVFGALFLIQLAIPQYPAQPHVIFLYVVIGLLLGFVGFGLLGRAILGDENSSPIR